MALWGSICVPEKRSISEQYRKLVDLTGFSGKTTVFAMRNGLRKYDGDGKLGLLPPPALASVLRLGRLAVKASPVAEWRRRSSPCHPRCRTPGGGRRG